MDLLIHSRNIKTLGNNRYGLNEDCFYSITLKNTSSINWMVKIVIDDQLCGIFKVKKNSETKLKPQYFVPLKQDPKKHIIYSIIKALYYPEHDVIPKLQYKQIDIKYLILLHDNYYQNTELYNTRECIIYNEPMYDIPRNQQLCRAYDN